MKCKLFANQGGTAPSVSTCRIIRIDRAQRGNCDCLSQFRLPSTIQYQRRTIMILQYLHRLSAARRSHMANRNKLLLHAQLILFFFCGGVMGAVGFKRIGYSATRVLSAWLALLAIGPIMTDIRLRWNFRQRQIARNNVSQTDVT
jgi:hypothetical protein